MNVCDADRVEELAEIAAAFLADLGGQRGLVVHGDEASSAPVTQAFFGLSYEEIDAILFDYMALAELNSTVCFEESPRGQALMAPLQDSSGDCLGLLYADTSGAFPEQAPQRLDDFAQEYVRVLLEICVVRPAPPARGLANQLPFRS